MTSITKKINIYLGKTISDALKNLSVSKLKICIVIDKKKNFKGVLNDGDIRRALLQGENVNTKIDKIYNRKPFVLKENYNYSLALKQLELRQIDQAPIIKNNKVVGILSNKKTVLDNLKVPAVIMCGGLGKRLKPLTKQIPKALVKINNTPMLSIVLNNLKKYGFNDFIFSTYHKSNLIKKYYKRGKSKNIKIRYIREKTPLGTAGSLSLIKKEIKENFFLLTNCDVISDINYRNLINFHKKNNADLTIAVKKLFTENLYGEIKMRGTAVKHIYEKPKKEILINSAIYIVNTKCINFLDYNRRIDMDEFIVKLIKKKRKVTAYPFLDNWQDIGTKQELKNFKSYLSNQK